MLALLVAAVVAGRLARADCRVEVVRPESSERRDQLTAWLKANAEGAGWPEGAWLFDQRSTAYTLYVVDVDNDGALEHVLTSMEGSGGYLGLRMFRPVASGWKHDARNPFGEQPVHEYRDPLGDGSRLFLRVCGTTWIQLAGGIYPGLYPEPYVWQGSDVRPACDSHWVREQRRVFRALYDRQFHREAFGLLGGVQECAARTDPAAWLSIQSDRALVAHHLGLDDECLAFVAAARASAGFASASPVLRKAIDSIARLCELGRTGEAGGYDFSWLREVAEKDPARQLTIDRRFPALLRAVVPDGPDADKAREHLTLSLFVPTPARIVEGRHVVVSGCRPHDCESKGLIWVDTEARTAIFAAGGMAGSRQVPSTAVPAAFWKALLETAPGLATREDETLVYLEPDGTRTDIRRP